VWVRLGLGGRYLYISSVQGLSCGVVDNRRSGEKDEGEDSPDLTK
jgi:hypothetical protein